MAYHDIVWLVVAVVWAVVLSVVAWHLYVSLDGERQPRLKRYVKTKWVRIASLRQCFTKRRRSDKDRLKTQ